MSPAGGAPRVWLAAGEESGDQLGGRLIGSLRALAPGVEVRGVGGPAMAAQGWRASSRWRTWR